MHKYSQQEAPLAVVVDPCHQNSTRCHLDDKDDKIGYVERSVRANASPKIAHEVPYPPNDGDYDTRDKSAVLRLKPREGESGPAKFL